MSRLICAFCGCYARDVSKGVIRCLIGVGWVGVGWGGGTKNVHSAAITHAVLTTRSWCYALNLLLELPANYCCCTLGLLLELPTRSCCYPLLALRTSNTLFDATLLTCSWNFQHALDAMLLTCSWNYQIRSWCYVLNLFLELPTNCGMLCSNFQ